MNVIAHLLNPKQRLFQQHTDFPKSALPKKFAVLLSILSITLLAGCGFQLRGYGANPIALESIALKFAADAPSNQWDYALKRQLAQSGIALSDDAETLLTLRDIKSAKDIVSYDSRGKAAEYELVQTVSITIETRAVISDADATLTEQSTESPTERPPKANKTTTTTIAPYHNTLKKSRVYTFDPENVTGKSQEERLLTREIQAELIRDIIQRLGDYSQQRAAANQSALATPQTTPAVGTP